MSLYWPTDLVGAEIIGGLDCGDIMPQFAESFSGVVLGVPCLVKANMEQKIEKYDGRKLVVDVVREIPLVDGETEIYGYFDYPLKLRFDGSRFLTLSANFRRTLIAHELAHWYCDHQGDYSDADESQADDLVESWGFPAIEFRRYIDTKGRSGPRCRK